jgi:arylsulfatase A-like enzyme
MPVRPGPVVPILLLALLAAHALTSSCLGRFDEAHDDVVLIVVDTLRADHLGIYGYDRGTSPRIDALARQATVFESAWSTAPWTLPSVMSMMTSRLPSSHRVENDGLKLGAGVPTLAETMKRAGYSTGAFVSHVYVSSIFGFDRGFETFEDFGVSRPSYRPEARMEPAADRVTDAALAWLSHQGRKPVFLFVHYFDAHWPYEPPERFRALYPDDYHGPLDATYDSISKFQDARLSLPDDYRRFLIDRYDGEIRFVDEQIGRLLDGLAASGRGPRAFLVVTADHGEEFKDHGSIGHGRRLYEEVVRVPLIMGRLSPKAGPPPARVTVPVSGIDLLPTIAEVAGAVPPPGVQGTSLVPLLHAEPSGTAGAAPTAPPADRPLVSETIRLNAHLKAIRRGPLKLIQSMDENRAELYDLAADPRERDDLSQKRPEDRRALVRALFSQVDFLSGGWNLRWSGDGRKHRFQGQIRTKGIFRTVVPLFRERGKYVLESPGTLNFTDDGQEGTSGLSFTIAPEESGADFYLLIDGRPLLDHIFLGGNESHPRFMPFALEGRPTLDAAYTRPPRADRKELGFFIWHLRPAGSEQSVVLDDEIRERLRSLGYIN